MSDEDNKRQAVLGPDAEADEQRPRGRALTPEEDAQNRTFAVEAARLAADLHCEDVMVLDIRGLSELSDYIVIGSGTSDRQIRSVAGDIGDLAKQMDLQRIGHEVDGSVNWLVADFVDVVVHLFEPNARAHYDLEMLWGDAKKIRWRRESSGGQSETDSEAQA